MQNVWLVSVTFGVGFTVIVNVTGVPVHDTPPLAKVGVTVTVVVIGLFPVLVAVNVGSEPLPPVLNPMGSFVRDHV